MQAGRERCRDRLARLVYHLGQSNVCIFVPLARWCQMMSLRSFDILTNSFQFFFWIKPLRSSWAHPRTEFKIRSSANYGWLPRTELEGFRISVSSSSPYPIRSFGKKWLLKWPPPPPHAERKLESQNRPLLSNPFEINFRNRKLER